MSLCCSSIHLFSLMIFLVVIETCKTKNCQYYSTCKLISGSPRCICPKAADCTKVVSPVCGSDNKDYLNKCQLQVRACALRIKITVKNLGLCGKKLLILIILSICDILLTNCKHILSFFMVRR